MLADSLARENLRIIADAKARADTVKSPLARAEFPASTEIGTAWQYDRYSLSASGALTLGEILDHIPGVTVYRSGWIGSPHVASSLGDFNRVRIFYDGIELDALDPRMGGLLDLSTIDIWHLEGARVERAANETRVFLRSWRARSTTPETRVDISTGDLETNTYRGFFSRRFRNGVALQAGASQGSSRDVRNGGDINGLSLFGRFGWAVGKWSVDGSLLRANRERSEQLAIETHTNLPALDATRSLGYLRASFGDPDGPGRWVQIMASTQRFKASHPALVTVDSIPGPDGGGPGGSIEAPDTISVSGDTTAAIRQYVAAVGWNAGPVRLSYTARLRPIEGFQRVSQTGRVGFERPRFAVGLLAERSTNDRTVRIEASGRVLPLPYLALGGAVSRIGPTEGVDRPTTLAARGDVGLRFGRLWATGGLMTRDTATILPPIVFDTTFKGAATGRTNGLFAALRGKVWKDVGIEAYGVRWGAESAYLPQYEVRSEAYVNTSWPSKFPSGHLNLMLAITHEYRSRAFFPGPATTGEGAALLESSQYRVWGALLEIKLLSATLTYQYRNFFGAQYQQVPGFEMPRPVNFYGVRWYFVN